jgi:two-component system sensor histidine kinase RegB
MDASTAQTLPRELGRPTDPTVGPLPDQPRDASDERGRINLSWLVQLHWWGILGQAVVVVGAEAMTGIALPSTTLVALLVVEVVGNFALGAWASRVRVTDGAIAAVMLLDIIVLTVLLDLTGGAANPFSTLYLVNVALAAVLLPGRWSWPLMMASLLAFGGLFVHEELVGPSHHVRMLIDHRAMIHSHLRGMWVACALSAIFVVFFVQRVSSALADREQELDRTRAQSARREKLASLATLAAGAAHELGTPLSTIAVVIKELERALPTDASKEVRDDLRLVREQVTRCREILDRMAAHAGETVGETIALVTTERWVASALDGLRQRDRVRVAAVAAGAAVRGPPRALADALRGLMKNAIQASPADREVVLRLSAEQDRVRATVKDSGPGMPPEILARVGEPFFTTKGPGDGMGLGLFLTRALAEQLGGEFHIVSHQGAGTEAWIELPAAEPTAERSAS